MAGDKDGKTEKATPKRAQEARNEGRIAKSADLVAWVSLLAGFTVVQSTIVKGGRFLELEMTEMSNLIAQPDQATALKFFIDSLAEGLKIVAPLTITFVVLGVLGHFAQVRFVLAFKSLKPNFKKLNVFAGIKNMFSAQSLFNAGKELTKTIVLGYIAYTTLWSTMMGITTNGPYGIPTLISIAANAAVDFVRYAAAAGIVIGIAEYFYQRKKIGDGTKMSKDEVKQEHKAQDGNPEVKGKIRQKQFNMSRNRMMLAMKDADVVVVNPVHVAVALKYDPESGAPRVVAKGAGFVAEKIRDKAEEYNVPLVQDIPLARTLHRMCDLEDEIPGELFEAVARMLAFVFSLRNRGNASGFHKMPGTPDLAEYEREEARKAAEERFGASSSSGATDTITLGAR